MKAEVSVPVALATGAVVVGVFQFMQPSAADQRTVQPGSPAEQMLASTETGAFYTSVAIVAGISLIAKDPVPFWVGGLVAVAMSWHSRVARNIDPATNGMPGISAGSLQGKRYNVEAAAA